MKILLLGVNGQVGWECQRSLSILGELEAHDRTTADFQNAEQLRDIVRGSKPDIIVNAVAYTAVDQAENDAESAYQVNRDAVAILAEEANNFNATLIHYSTDYVFDGEKTGRYCEGDPTNPQSVYGKSKLDGEHAIIKNGCKHFIFRTSWVYASRGNNFAKTMIKLATERDELKVVADQFGAPTSAELIADITAQLVMRIHEEKDFAEKHSGVYNLVASGEASWHDFAKYVLQKSSALGTGLKVQPSEVKPITTAEFPRPAFRPSNSKLDTTKLQSLLGTELPDWRFHVERMVTEYTENQS